MSFTTVREWLFCDVFMVDFKKSFEKKKYFFLMSVFFNVWKQEHSLTQTDQTAQPQWRFSNTIHVCQDASIKMSKWTIAQTRMNENWCLLPPVFFILHKVGSHHSLAALCGKKPPFPAPTPVRFSGKHLATQIPRHFPQHTPHIPATTMLP